jgi:hypothetical protein
MRELTSRALVPWPRAAMVDEGLIRDGVNGRQGRLSGRPCRFTSPRCSRYDLPRSGRWQTLTRLLAIGPRTKGEALGMSPSQRLTRPSVRSAVAHPPQRPRQSLGRPSCTTKEGLPLFVGVDGGTRAALSASGASAQPFPDRRVYPPPAEALGSLVGRRRRCLGDDAGGGFAGTRHTVNFRIALQRWITFICGCDAAEVAVRFPGLPSWRFPQNVGRRRAAPRPSP